MTRPNKLKCLCLTNTFQSILTFAGSTRSLPKMEASERSSNWVCSGLAFKLRPDWKGFSMANPLAYWSSLSVTKEKSFITWTPDLAGWPENSVKSSQLNLLLTKPHPSIKLVFFVWFWCFILRTSIVLLTELTVKLIVVSLKIFHICV